MSVKDRTMMLLVKRELHSTGPGSAGSNHSKLARKRLECLFCTSCGRILDCDCFADNQAKKSIFGRRQPTLESWPRSSGRTCISCGADTRNSRYASRVLSVDEKPKLLCEHCCIAVDVGDEVFLRDGRKTCCRACADARGLKYTKAKSRAGFVVYDDLIDVDQLFQDRSEGKI